MKRYTWKDRDIHHINTTQTKIQVTYKYFRNLDVSPQILLTFTNLLLVLLFTFCDTFLLPQASRAARLCVQTLENTMLASRDKSWLHPCLVTEDTFKQTWGWHFHFPGRGSTSTINSTFWQKLFPYKTKNLTHRRWKSPANSSCLSPCQHWRSCCSTERAFQKGQEAAKPKVTVFTSSSVVCKPDSDNRTKNIILHLHKEAVCSAGEQGNSISKEIKEMPQALSQYIAVYF